MAAFAADEFVLDIDEASYLSFEDFTHSTISPDFDLDIETLAHGPGSPFSFDSDHDHDLSPCPFRMQGRSPPFWDCLEADLAADGLEWEEIIDADVPGIGSGTEGGGGAAAGGIGIGIGVDDADVFGFSERDVLGGIDSGDESIFSDEQPFDFDEGQELDDLFASEGWGAVLPAELDDDEFEVLPVHMVDAVVGGAPPAARGAVERLQVVAISGEDAAQGCAVCKDGIVKGELATRLPCAHFYHGDCIGPWLAIRNSCPVCRYELPTDDPDYEKQRERRCFAGGSAAPELGSPMHI